MDEIVHAGIARRPVGGPLPSPLAENPVGRDQGQETNQEGIGDHGRLEALPLVDEHETPGETEGRLRVGRRASHSAWIAEAWWMSGGDRYGGGGNCRGDCDPLVRGANLRLNLNM
jgi:hypothetical protein